MVTRGSVPTAHCAQRAGEWTISDLLLVEWAILPPSPLLPILSRGHRLNGTLSRQARTEIVSRSVTGGRWPMLDYDCTVRSTVNEVSRTEYSSTYSK